MAAKPRRPPWITRKNYAPEKDFIVPIGKLIYWHSWLDSQLELVLLSLLGIAALESAQAVLAHIARFEARVDLFSQLANLLIKDSANKINVKQIHGRLVDLNAKRNHIVHGRHSGFSWPPLKLGILRARPQSQIFETKPYFYEPREIQNIANEMLKLGTDLGALKHQINARLHDPSRKTSHERFSV